MKIKKILPLIIGGIVISFGIAYGFTTDQSQFFRYFVLSMIGLSGAYFWFNQKQTKDEKFLILENLLQEADDKMVEMENAIFEYQEILNEITTSFPCNCGENNFEGIFVPNEEHYVECDNCKSKYKISMNINSVQISEAIQDLNIDKLIKEKIKTI
jgi:hypothetical protein